MHFVKIIYNVLNIILDIMILKFILYIAFIFGLKTKMHFVDDRIFKFVQPRHGVNHR